MQGNCVNVAHECCKANCMRTCWLIWEVMSEVPAALRSWLWSCADLPRTVRNPAGSPACTDGLQKDEADGEDLGVQKCGLYQAFHCLWAPVLTVLNKLCKGPEVMSWGCLITAMANADEQACNEYVNWWPLRCTATYDMIIHQPNHCRTICPYTGWRQKTCTGATSDP